MSVLGIMKRKPVWLVIAAVLALPIALYLAANPWPGWPAALAIPLALAGSGIAVRRRHIKTAWFLLGPLVGVSTLLAILVMSQ